MNKAFEKILERLEELQNYACFPTEWVNEEQSKIHSYYANKLTEILKLTEQYSNGWIPCSERLPEESGEYLVTSKIYFVPDHVDEIDNYVGVKISHYSTRCGWLDDEVMAWQPLPEPYRERD